MKVLIAEDDEMMLKAMVFRLKREGFDVIACANGQEAISKITTDQPDVIITDIQMPFVTGLDIVRKVRSELNLKIPIIMLSAMGLEKTVVEAFELGADDFITKPFNPNELIVRVQRFMPKG
jgi:DNA-binding response OmpR family regulator